MKNMKIAHHKDRARFRAIIAGGLFALQRPRRKGLNRCLCQWVCWTVFFMPLGLAQAEDSHNLFGNGGFEENESALSEKIDKNRETLIERTVVLPDDAEPMPKLVTLNAGEGWVDSHCVFEYRQGRPGEEVHTGARAIYIASPKESSAVLLGTIIPVVSESESTDAAIQFGKPYKYSFYAKGKGVVRIRLYMFESVQILTNLYDYARLQTVNPASHLLIDDGEWHEYTGTVRVNTNEVGAVRFVMSAKGEVSIDDVQLRP
ncbi:MAG: hypothetical protein WC765_04820 [Phycisphaerae bacterium]